MKKYLLVLFIFAFIGAGAQTDSKCMAQFKYEFNTMIMSPLPVTAVNFYDASEGDVVDWLWNFGDGNSSREQNPFHMFNRPISRDDGMINPFRIVSLTIVTSDSCKSFYADTINIMEGIPNNELYCNAGYRYYVAEYDSLSGTASVQFKNVSEGDSLNYFWQFDNDRTSTEKDPLVVFDIGQNEYNVCLTVEGVNDCTNTYCQDVYIKNPNDTIINPECITHFSYAINHDILTFAPALVLDFYSRSDPEAVEWNWDFGDGSTSTEENSFHIFNYPQNIDSVLGDPNPFRNVCLTVKTANGCVARYCETINIYMNDSSNVDPEECQARFRYYQQNDVITIPELVPYQFVDASEGDVIDRLWEFEDGTASIVAEPQINFDIFKPTQKVCLTITTSDSCTSTWCEYISVRKDLPDSVNIPDSDSNYIMRYEASFPIYMSSCAGYVKAQVYLGDSLINATDYKWSHGVEGQEANGFCPTRTYSVKAKTPDGIIVSGTFVFNADGTVTVTPINWWVSGDAGNPVIQYRTNNTNYFVEWQLCDGTVVKADSIQFNLINCGDQVSNLILKDSLGNVVYTESISQKSVATFINSVQNFQKVKLFPNPVTDVLNIQYSGRRLDKMVIEICDFSGRRVLIQNIQNVESGQHIGLNVHSLVNGIYFCKMISGNQLIGVEKFTK